MMHGAGHPARGDHRPLPEPRDGRQPGRRHDLHHEFADEKQAAWEKLGQWIDDILG